VQGHIVPMEDGGAGTSSVMDNGRGLEPGLVGGGSGMPRRRDGTIAPPNKAVRPTAGTEGGERGWRMEKVINGCGEEDDPGKKVERKPT
jgi:hypothetical protein